VHITDTHLPTRYFYSDDPELATTDTSSIIDLRKVIDDINIINPEFVIMTGDLVNESELEDFENGRCYTKAQRILSELEVPVFVVSGNHDLGGWDDTPPSQGTSRRDWWRFFGWKWLQYQNHTQDYSFEYNQTLFIGLEAYDNYDSYMYSTYGAESFTSEQLDWLNNELSDSERYDNRVLFYHYDFSDQINLSSLDVDMVLWGHIHSDEGSIDSRPYNIATDNICDGDCAYRVIKIHEGELEPKSTCYADLGGDNITLLINDDFLRGIQIPFFGRSPLSL
jgi:3',5'-cyclic AMP phosphodiesterase CpdA